MKVCVFLGAMILSLLSAGGVASAAPKSGQLELSGYLQSRFENFENAANGSDTVNGFLLRRARLGLTARPSGRVLVRLELAGDDGETSHIKDAFLRYYLRQGWTGASISVGQMKLPFGLEIMESSRDRLAPERAQWVRFLFPEIRDKGLLIMTEDGRLVKVFLGVFNGNGGARDDNNAKAFVGRVELRPTGNVVLGGSVYLGDQYISYTSGNINRRRVGGDARLALGDLVLTGEYVDARHLWTNPTAWMMQGALQLDPRSILVCRIDRLDEGLTYYGSSRSYNVGLVHDITQNLRGKLFWEFNRESGPQIKNDVLRAEAIARF